jgi:beta-glucanase (GH16 family)
MKNPAPPMKPLAFLLAVAFFQSLPINSTPAPSLIPVEGYRLVWSDEFDGESLDSLRWDYRTDSKMWSTQKPENVSVSNGLLRIAVQKAESGGMHYSGGGVISRESFQYGYYEARLKIPPGAGWHTSFWMMFHNGKGGTSADSACQELDVIENDSINHTSYGVNIHKWKGVHVPFGGKRVKTPDLAADFHVYGCEFTPSTVNYYFDGKLVQSVDVTKAVKKGNVPVDFEHGPQNIWLTSIASPLGGTKAVDDTLLPSAAEFDYVRFYEKTPANHSSPIPSSTPSHP